MSVRRLAPADVQPKSFAFNAANAAWVEKQIAKYPPGRQASAVIPLLWRAQEQEGWVSEKAIEVIAETLAMPKIRVLEVATFYTMFNLEPVGRHFVQLCGTVPCHLRGAEELKSVCKRVIGPERHVTSDGALSWLEVECLGACVNAPMVQINADYYEDLTPEKLEWILSELRAGRVPAPGPQNGRQFSAPEGGDTTLTEEAIFRTSPRVTAPGPAPDDALTDVGAKRPTVEGSQQANPAPAQAIVAAAKADGKSAGDAAPASPPPTVEPPKPEPVLPAKDGVVAASAAGGTAHADATLMKGPHAPQGGDVARGAPVTGEAVSEAWKPELLTAPRGTPDDLKLIWGVGPKLERILHGLGVYHFSQIAAWTDDNLRWIDAHLEGFKGRARRDDWIGQAKKLATGWRPTTDVGEKPKA